MRIDELRRGVAALEMLSTVDGARYRAQPPGTAAQILDFAAADGSLNVLGPFTQVTKPFSSTSHYLAVYNVGVPGADAYELANVITPAGHHDHDRRRRRDRRGPRDAVAGVPLRVLVADAARVPRRRTRDLSVRHRRPAR